MTDILIGTWEERNLSKEEEPYPMFRRRFYCSACGNWNTYGMTSFCPDCGARMENASNYEYRPNYDPEDIR